MHGETFNGRHTAQHQHVKMFSESGRRRNALYCDCSFYNSERVKCFDYIRDTVPNFACLNSFDKMVWLMTCENKDIVNEFAEFVSTCFTLRKTG